MHADWLVCSDVCVPEDGSAELTLPVKDNSGEAAAQQRRRVVHARAAEIPAAWSAASPHASLEWKDRVLTINSLGGRRVEFYPSPQSTPVINPSGAVVRLPKAKTK